MAYYSRPEEVVEAFRTLFNAHKEQLGFAYVALNDEVLIPEYPALLITTDQMERVIHAMQQFEVTFNLTFWVYHAQLSDSHQQRTIDDMKLATGVVQFIHMNRTLSGRLIFSFVDSELPGFTATETGPNIITTRLGWNGKSVVNYSDS